MIGEFVNGKVHVFIDGANIFYSHQTLGWKISYQKLMEYFQKECGEGMKCHIYLAYDETKPQEKKFLDMLDINGYILHTKALKKISLKKGILAYKGNLDMELGLDMVESTYQYDTAVLMSGDSDFAAPVERIKKRGKRIIVMSTRGRISKELLELAKYIDLRKLKDEISQ